ncbi:MAG TPA: bifunctional nuclease family protein [Candidatus Dormibacteraeota bacterium]|nr:bifunctional nuclease family protein [Candidatus Dormibacteraeota bacterium]
MDLVEVSVDSIRVHMPSGQHVVVLREKDAERFLPIWVGVAEANAINLKLDGVQPERPMTHDLIVNAFHEFELTVSRVVVSDLRNDTFYAEIQGRRGGRDVHLDSRPSDAIALAIRLDTPIFVAREVLDQAGVIPEGNDEEAKLKVFQEIVNEMNLPDLEDRDS